MKKKLQKLMYCLLLILSVNLTSAQSFVVNGLRYTVTTDTNVSVEKDGSCPTGTVNIPETVTNSNTIYTVTSISDYAFQYCSDITMLTIPDSVTYIGDSAFESCSSLTAISIPDSVTYIEDYAFYQCTGLTSVSIPSSITQINNYVFQFCSGLTSVTIPDSVTSIGEGAFDSCSKLTTVTIPNSVTEIREYTFYSCTALTELNVSWDTPLNITSNVFLGLTLSGITLNVPSTVANLYRDANVWKEFDIKSVALSTKNYIVENAISIYPIPTTDVLNINLKNNIDLKSISLYNQLGQLIKKEKHSRVEVSSLTKGIYFAYINTTEGPITKKIIIE